MKCEIGVVHILLFCCLIQLVAGYFGLIKSARNIVMDWYANSNEQPADDSNILPEYDFIIVGAGSAGCVVANRLTQVANWSVLLIEAGDKQNYFTTIPALAPYILFTDWNWKYKAEPLKDICLGMEDRRCAIHAGKMLGGGSALNLMMYNRGSPFNYDGWEQMGNPGWGWKDVLPLFLKIEDVTEPDLAKDTEYHSTKGEVPISYANYRTQIVRNFIEAGEELGYKITDPNGKYRTGFSYMQSTTKNGVRWSSARAFLNPAKDRKNLHVKVKSTATKILIDPKTNTAYGVEFINDETKHTVRARKEVIVSAGTVRSPQLLMLSGIGPRKHLDELGIPVLQDLKVGFNLMDHPMLPTIFTINESISLRSQDIYVQLQPLIEYFTEHKGPLSSAAGCEAYAFLDSKNRSATDGHNDVELIFIGAGYQNALFLYKSFGYSEKFHELYLRPLEGTHSWTILPVVVQPKSRGRVQLKSKNPLEKPLIYLNFFENSEDLETLVRALKIMIELSKTEAFQKIGSKLYEKPVPGCEDHEFASDEYWRCAARHASFCIYHYSGTCKMGPASDPGAVVDSRLRVHGVKRLRVIDASIMPQVPSAHTNAAVMMIGENGAKFIKEDWGMKT